MSKYSIEDKIGFHLVKVKGAAAKSGVDAYRAVMEHDGLSPEETLAELAKETGISSSQIRYFGSSILNALYEGTIRDGRSRNFENFFSTRFDITGKFDRIDAPFDENKHQCVLGIVPGSKVGEYSRQKPPVNEIKTPRGRFDYITYPGGEKTFVKIGEEIEIHGHDLLLGSKLGYLMLITYDSSGKEHYLATAVQERLTIDRFDARVLYNSEDFLRLNWPEGWTLEFLKKQATLQIRYLDCSGKGAHDSFSHPVTILR